MFFYNVYFLLSTIYFLLNFSFIPLQKRVPYEPKPMTYNEKQSINKHYQQDKAQIQHRFTRANTKLTKNEYVPACLAMSGPTLSNNRLYNIHQ